MTVHGSNGETWITETVPVIISPSSVDAPDPVRSFSVFYYDIHRAIKALEEQPLMFRVYEYQLSVHHSCGFFRMRLENLEEEFLNIKKPTPDTDSVDGYRFEYEAPGLRSILSKCNYAMADDELRPVMCGVYINLTKDFSDYVSSDAHILVRVRKKSVLGGIKDECSLIISSYVARTLLKILPKTGDVIFEYQKKKDYKGIAKVIIDNNTTLAFYTVDGRYPRYLGVIPETHEYEMTVSRRQLIKSIDRLGLFAHKPSELIVMDISKKNLHLNTECIDEEMDGEETLTCDFSRIGVGADNLRIGLNIPKTSSMLKVLSTDEVMFHFIDSTRPIIIHPKPQSEVEDVTILIMPMLLSD